MSDVNVNDGTKELYEQKAPLYKKYDGQLKEQNAYIFLAENGVIAADWDAEIGNAIPMDVYHDRTLRFEVSPYLTGEELKETITQSLSLLQEIHDNHSVEWDGSNHVGVLQPRADQAIQRLEQQLLEDQGSLEPYDDVQSWLGDADISNFYQEGESFDEFLANVFITEEPNQVLFFDKEDVLEYVQGLDKEDIPEGLSKIVENAIDVVRMTYGKKEIYSRADSEAHDKSDRQEPVQEYSGASLGDESRDARDASAEMASDSSPAHTAPEL